MSKTPDEIVLIRKRIADRRDQARTLSCMFPRGIVLRANSTEWQPQHGAAIAPSTRTAGRWQVYVFDQDGFSNDYSEASYEEAIFQAMNEGFWLVDMELLDRVGGTAQFMGGNIWSMLPDDKKWSTRVADVRAELERPT